MKVTYNWLKDFVDITLKPEALADKLTMAGLEVKAIDAFDDDFVFEIEITSNRPDWLSVIGIAREIAAITGKKLKIAKTRRTMDEGRRTKDDGRWTVTIEDKAACPFYSARIIRDVKVEPSPTWMVKRLQAIGLRPVNNIVDITNYVLFTTGQPLHAFDVDKINSHHVTASPRHQRKIIVRRARNTEEIITIDGVIRRLTPEILVIADEKNPIAIAGIMGGEETEVHGSTRNILLESAYFSPLVTRGASRLLGISSDSSYRFERSVDKASVVENSDYAAKLILTHAGGELGELYKAGSPKTQKKIITFNVSSVKRLLGQEIALSKVKSIFKALEFKVAASGKNVLKIEVPAFRQDVTSEIDVIEEVCRIAGYDTIPLSIPAIKLSAPQEDVLLTIQEKIRETLIGAGAHEVITYSLVSEESLRKARVSLASVIRLQNPLSMEQEVLRPTLLWGLLTSLRCNVESGSRKCSFFEIGDCFNQGVEFRALGLIADGRELLEVKGIVELLLEKLGLCGVEFFNSMNASYKEGQTAGIRIGDKEIGTIGRVKEEILADCKIDLANIIAAELNLENLKPFVNFQKIYGGLPIYPSVTRDISLVINEGIVYQKIVGAIDALSLENLEHIRYKGLYRSEEIGKGKKSLTLSLEFRSPERTLTDAEVNAYLEEIIRKLSLELQAVIR